MKWKANSFSSNLKSTPSRSTLPIFTSKLKNYYGRQGDTLKLQCRVDGEPTPVISWLKEGKPVMGSDRLEMCEEKGVHFLQIKDSVKEDSGRYTVKAVNSKGNSHCSADVEITGKKLNTPAEKTPKLASAFRTSSINEKHLTTTYSTDINKQVDEFHTEANNIMAELDSMTPRHQSGQVLSSCTDSQCSPPSFTLNLKDCQAEEGDSLDLMCRTEGEEPGLEHSPPQFVKILHDETVEEGDSVTIQCKSSHEDDHGMKTRAPKFTQQLTDQEVNEGDSITIEVHSSHDYQHAAAPRFVQELKDEEVEEGESVTIECKTPHNVSSTGAPVFVEKLHDVVAEEGGSLTLECQNLGSKITSHSPPLSAPDFVTKLEDHEVEEGDSVTIECKGPTDHPHSHSYQTEYSQQDSPTHTQKPQEVTTYTAQDVAPPRFVKTLKDDQLEEGDSLTISCHNSNMLSATKKPEFIKSLSNQVLEEGDSVTLTCTTQQSSEPTMPPSPPKFVKELKDGEVEEGESLVIECSQAPPSPSETLPSTLPSTVPSTTHCSLSPVSKPPSIVRQLADVSVTVGSPAELIMETSDQPPAPEPEKPMDLTPRILEPLEEALTITDNSTVELVCRISNVTAEDVTWTKNERMARRGTRFQTSSSGDKFSYKISDCMSIDKGVYTVTASTKHGEVSSKCTITYTSDSLPTRASSRQSSISRTTDSSAAMAAPRFSSSLADKTVSEKESVVMECKVQATPECTIKWTCNSSEIKPSSTVDMTLEAGLARLTIKEVALSAQGRYTAVASNAAGSDRTSCFLDVQRASSSKNSSVSNVHPFNIPPISKRPKLALGASFSASSHKYAKISA